MTPTLAYIIGALALAILSIPLILKAVPPNLFYGFKTPSTLADPDLWYRANTFAGWAFLAASIVSGILAWDVGESALPPPAMGIAFAVPLVIATIASLVYLHRAKQKTR